MKNPNIPPITKFKSQSPRVACMLSDWMIAKLFWKKKIITVNDKGEINFSFNSVDYSYQVFEPAKLFELKKSRVIIRFSSMKPDLSFIFNELNDDFICEVELRPTLTKDKPEILHKHVGALNKIHAYIKRQRNRDLILADNESSSDKMNRLSKRLGKKLLKENVMHLSES